MAMIGWRLMRWSRQDFVFLCSMGGACMGHPLICGLFYWGQLPALFRWFLVVGIMLLVSCAVLWKDRLLGKSMRQKGQYFLITQCLGTVLWFAVQVGLIL